MRVLTAAVVSFLALVAAAPDALAGETPPVWKDGWTFNLPGRGKTSGTTPGSYYVQDGAPAPFAERADFGLQGLNPQSYTDYSIGHTLGRDLGLGNIQATLGVRMAEPLVANGFTPAFDPRRYVGAGPRLGLEGNAALPSSWVVEWQVGASVLSGSSAYDASGSNLNSALPNFNGSGSFVNVDGLLGLSYFFDTASKLTVGYRADYFKGSPSLNVTGAAADGADHIYHGPMIRFSVQK